MIEGLQPLGGATREAAAPVRVHHHGKHYIIYQVLDDHILVMRVLREEADLSAFLDGLDVEARFGFVL